MRKKRFSLRVLAAAVVVGLLCGLMPVGAWAAAPAGEAENELHTLHTDRTVEEDVRYERRQYQTTEPVERIVVDEGIADVIVRAAEDANTETITVDYTDEAESASSLYTFTVENGTLTIRKKRKSPSRPWWLGEYKYVSGRDSLVITLPQKQYGSISATADIGAITFKNVCAQEITGVLEIGNIRLENTVSDVVEMTLDIGDIELQRASASVYECKVKIGSIEGALVGNEADYAIGNEDKTGSGSGKRIEFVSKIGNADFQFVQ